MSVRQLGSHAAMHMQPLFNPPDDEEVETFEEAFREMCRNAVHLDPKTLRWANSVHEVLRHLKARTENL
jgi:hypothetical protein